MSADTLFEQRYRAMSARDARFDGQFIAGVHSTGIYCRPSCPATTPKRANVSFYLTAAAAHEAGLRACKRCLPDAVPGSPEWNIRDDLSAQAMRLIADGVVERAGVPGLAARLGYTPRHLTRVLQGELGAGPAALARAQRAQTARMLLVGTAIPMVDVAFAAGFGSVRQFNDTIAAVYELTPTEVRARGRSRAVDAPPDDGISITLRLPARGPFDGAGVLEFLGTRALPGVETWDGTSYTRSLRLPAGSAVAALRVDEDAPSPAIRCDVSLTSLSDLMPLVSRVRRLLDLDADAEAIDGALASDAALAASVSAVPGIRVPGSVEPHETVFRTLVGQQVSVASARTALSRLTAAIGEPAVDAHAGWMLFPTPAQIAQRGAEVLRGPAARIATILDVARRLDAGSLRVDVGMSTAELTAELTAVAGIGPWTAGYLAMRVLGSPDVLLTSDVAIRSGARRLGLPDDARALAERGAGWAPWRSYAGMHLWQAAARDPAAGRVCSAPASMRAMPTSSEITERLRAAGCVFAEEEAAILQEAAVGADQLEDLLGRRVAGEPLEVVVGWAEFAGLRIAVASGVFIPRRRTQLLAREAIAATSPGSVVVDLCCGSGAIGAAVAASVPDADVYAADIEPAAVRVARRNLPADRVFEGDLFSALPPALRGRIDVLAVNAPYVPTDEIRLLPPEARESEPRITLDGGGDGLDVHRRVVAGAQDWLAPGGSLVIEVAERQIDAATALFEASGLRTRVVSDDDLDATVVVGIVI